MADHQDLDIPAIQDRIERLNPGNPQLTSDVAVLVDELNYVTQELQALQRSLEGIAEQLGRLQRGSQPGSDHRPMA